MIVFDERTIAMSCQGRCDSSILSRFRPLRRSQRTMRRSCCAFSDMRNVAVSMNASSVGALRCAAGADAIQPIHHVIGLFRRLAAHVAFGQIRSLVVAGGDDFKLAHVVGDVVKAQRGVAPADRHRLAVVGVHAPLEGNRAAQFLELVGGDPGVGHFTVVLQQGDLAGANAVVGNAVAKQVLHEVHLVREQVAGVAGAVGIVTAPVPEVPFVPRNLRRRAEPAFPVHVLPDLLGIGAVPLVVVAIPAPVRVRRVQRLEAPRSYQRDGAQDALRDELFRLQTRRWPGVPGGRAGIRPCSA